MTYNWTTYLYVKNAQGDVVQIVDGNGNTVVTYIYDAWGNMLYHYGSHVDDTGKYNPFRYRGYVYDTETGLYYLSSRYYNPVWGRFVNADTAAVVAASPDKANGDKNLFAYCDNNPISRKDDGGFSSGPDNFWPATNKGQDVNYAEMAIDATVGALTNLAAASRASVYTNSCKSGNPANAGLPLCLLVEIFPPQNTYRRAIWQRTFGASHRTINARPALSFFASVAPAAQDTGAGSPDEPEAL